MFSSGGNISLLDRPHKRQIRNNGNAHLPAVFIQIGRRAGGRSMRELDVADDDHHHHQRKHRHHPSPLISLLSGGIAGAVAKTVVAPLDRIKIIYQVSNSERFTFKAAFRSANHIIRNEGSLGLWKGNTATLLRIIPYAAIQYSCFEEFQRIWIKMYGIDINGDISGIGRFISGSIAGATSVIATYPLDLLRTRMAVDQHHPVRRLGHLHKITLNIIGNGGISGLYTGVVPTLLGIIPYAGISFWTFETLKSIWCKDQDTDFKPIDRLTFGACAGILAQSASYPLETIRRRMQVESNSSKHSIIELASNIYHNEGLIRGLYKGLSMNWIKGPIATGLSFTIYDLTKNAVQ